MKNNLYDVIIIGGGVAGLTAALYLSRAHYRVIVIERETFGGQITITSEIVNYPGIEKTDGKTLTKTMRKQAQNFGAEFIIANAEKIDVNNDIKKVYTDKGIFESFGILIATGANPRTLGFIGEEKFKGHGVAYCATCDGEFFTGKEIFVIDGGFAAAEESVFLTKYASHVTILIREDDFTCAKAVADSARNNKKITIYTNVEVTSVDGDSGIKKICYKNNITGEKYEYTSENNETIGVFVFAGYEPETSLIKDIVKLNQYGYIITDKNQKTNIDGLYAAGDVCEKSLRQIVTAVGDG
ncbi:MAG: FAD-dependent oxidoreductase, partial [Ruminococcus sp.]|nr:FAD-dependent oxidoreductase [Ruminococcus sp.]